MLRFLFPVLLILAPAAAAQNSDLRRLTLRQDSLGWEAVGRLDMPERSFCTGVLIATDLVLTAAHCMFDPRRGRARAAADLTFRAGLADGQSIAERAIKRIAVHPGYDQSAGQSTDNVRHDVALLELVQPIPAATAAPFPVIGLSQAGDTVSVVSYAAGREEALSWQLSCNVLGRGQGLIGVDCDVDYGSSGAPVFDRSRDRARILSIISGGANDGAKEFAIGMELPEAVAELKTTLRTAPLPAAPEPRIRTVTPDGAREGGARFIRP